MTDATSDAHTESPGPAAGTGTESVARAWQRSLDSLKAQCLGIVDLAFLEAKLATLSLVEMLALAIGAALFAITAWWLLMAGVTAQLMASGLSLAGALVLIGIVNVLLAAAAVLRIRKLSGNLQFAATRSALGSSAPPETTSTATASTETEDAVGPPSTQA